MLVFVLNQTQKANTGKIQTPVYENVREFGCLPDAVQRIAEKLSLLICTIFTGVLTWQAVLYFIRLDNSGQVTPAMLVPMSWAFLAVPVGCAFMFVHFFIELVTHGLVKKQEEAEVTHG